MSSFVQNIIYHQAPSPRESDYLTMYSAQKIEYKYI